MKYCVKSWLAAACVGAGLAGVPLAVELTLGSGINNAFRGIPSWGRCWLPLALPVSAAVLLGAAEGGCWPVCPATVTFSPAAADVASPSLSAAVAAGSLPSSFGGMTTCACQHKACRQVRTQHARTQPHRGGQAEEHASEHLVGP